MGRGARDNCAVSLPLVSKIDGSRSGDEPHQRHQPLRQPQYETEEHERPKHDHRGMGDDGHPRAAEVPGRQGIKEDPGDTGRPQKAPGHVQVVECTEHTVCQPVPLAEHAFHLGQQHTPEEELFTQDCIEHPHHDKQSQDPSGAHQLRSYFRRFQESAQFIARWRGEKREDRVRPAIHVQEYGSRSKMQEDNGNQPQP